MSNEGGTLLFGMTLSFFLGAAFTLALDSVLPEAPMLEYKKAIEECEKGLPRDQTCKIIGVINE